MAMLLQSIAPFLSCDHIGQAGEAAFLDSSVAKNVWMHCMKCTNMINVVLAPYFLKRVVADIGDSKYCLLAESTNVNVSEYSILVRTREMWWPLT